MKIMLFDIFSGELVHMRGEIVKVCINHLLHNGFTAITFVKKVVVFGFVNINLSQLAINDL